MSLCFLGYVLKKTINLKLELELRGFSSTYLPSLVTTCRSTQYIKYINTYPWWGKAVCHRSHVGKHCTGEHQSHQLLRRSETNRHDLGTCKIRQTSLRHAAFSLSMGGTRKTSAWTCVDVYEHRNPRKHEREHQDTWNWKLEMLNIRPSAIWVLYPLHLHYPHLNSICFSCRVTMATRGGRPVLSVCSSTLDDIICVVTSASAATPAPQQLQSIQNRV